MFFYVSCTSQCRKFACLKSNSAVGVFAWVIQSLDCWLERVNKCQPLGNKGFVKYLSPLFNGTLNICSRSKCHFNKKILEVVALILKI